MTIIHSGLDFQYDPTDAQLNFYAFRMKGKVVWNGNCPLGDDDNRINDHYFAYYIMCRDAKKSRNTRAIEHEKWMSGYYVYTMTHPINNAVFYVGYSSTPVGRYIEHFFSQQNQGMKYVIDSLNVSNNMPIMNIVKRFTIKEDAEEAEMELIKSYSGSVLLMNRQGAYGDFEFNHRKASVLHLYSEDY